MRMRTGTRAAASLVAACTMLAACGTTGPTAGPAHSSPAESLDGGVGYGSLPPEHGTPTKGGTVSIAEAPGAGPTYIFPITPAAQLSADDVDDFEDFMWRPLWWGPGPNGLSPSIDYSQSIAGPPTFTDNNKTVTIHLKGNWKWSDGTPVTANDVVFYYWLLKAAVKLSPANFGDYTPGLFPDNVSSFTAPNATTLVVKFTKTYNQNFDFLEQLNVLEPLPAQAWSKTSATGSIIPFDNLKNATAIYNFLSGQAKDLKTYGSNPLWQVVDGPYKISSFDPATDGNTMVANPSYTLGAPRITTVDNVAFTSVPAEFDQLLTGKLDAGEVDLSDLPEINQLKSKGYNIYGYPEWFFGLVIYNFKDTTGHFNSIINQLYIRQALAHLQDQQAEIKSRGIFDGAGGPDYGPIPAAPVSPFTPKNALTNPYPFSISTAKHLLSSHGWKVVPNGVTTCVKPGTGSNECGAGIPAGTPLKWDLYYSNYPPLTGETDEAWVSNLSEVGIQVKLISKTFNFIIQNYDDPSAPKNDNAWAMSDFGGFTIDYYPTTNELFNTTGSFNTGGFSNPQVNAAIHDSEYSTNPSALSHELGLITKLQPGLFEPNQDRIYAFKNTLSGPPAAFADATQTQFSPWQWYFIK